MRIYQDKFQIGDKVTWRDHNWAEWGVASLNDTPITTAPAIVTKVKDLDPSKHEGAGHTQWVAFGEHPDWWSGAFFKKVVEKHG